MQPSLRGRMKCCTWSFRLSATCPRFTDEFPLRTYCRASTFNFTQNLKNIETSNLVEPDPGTGRASLRSKGHWERKCKHRFSRISSS